MDAPGGAIPRCAGGRAMQVQGVVHHLVCAPSSLLVRACCRRDALKELHGGLRRMIIAPHIILGLLTVHRGCTRFSCCIALSFVDEFPWKSICVDCGVYVCGERSLGANVCCQCVRTVPLVLLCRRMFVRSCSLRGCSRGVSPWRTGRGGIIAVLPDHLWSHRLSFVRLRHYPFFTD